MEHNTDRILWTVLILAIGVALYIGFRPAANGLLHQGVDKIQAVMTNVNSNPSDSSSDSSGMVDSDDNSDFTYSAPNTANDTISIIKYKGKSANLTIPTYRKIGSVDYKVTAIGGGSFGNGAFQSNTSLEQVTIPDSVQTIGEWAFGNDSNLKSLTLGSGVTSIGGNAFINNSALTSVDIPDSVQTIGSGAFDEDSNLKSLTLGSGVKSIGDNAFSDNSALTRVDIPDSVQTIGSGAFNEDFNLASLTLGSGVTTIGKGAFSGIALTRVDFPASVKSIGDYAFMTTPLSAISFKSPVALGENTFARTKLTNVTLPTGSTYNTDQTNGNSTFDSGVTVTIK